MKNRIKIEMTADHAAQKVNSCLICALSEITKYDFMDMLKERTKICCYCGAIHAVENFNITIIGFKI